MDSGKKSQLYKHKLNDFQRRWGGPIVAIAVVATWSFLLQRDANWQQLYVGVLTGLFVSASVSFGQRRHIIGIGTIMLLLLTGGAGGDVFHTDDAAIILFQGFMMIAIGYPAEIGVFGFVVYLLLRMAGPRPHIIIGLMQAGLGLLTPFAGEGPTAQIAWSSGGELVKGTALNRRPYVLFMVPAIAIGSIALPIASGEAVIMLLRDLLTFADFWRYVIPPCTVGLAVAVLTTVLVSGDRVERLEQEWQGHNWTQRLDDMRNGTRGISGILAGLAFLAVLVAVIVCICVWGQRYALSLKWQLVITAALAAILAGLAMRSEWRKLVVEHLSIKSLVFLFVSFLHIRALETTGVTTILTAALNDFSQSLGGGVGSYLSTFIWLPGIASYGIDNSINVAGSASVIQSMPNGQPSHATLAVAVLIGTGFVAMVSPIGTFANSYLYDKFEAAGQRVGFRRWLRELFVTMLFSTVAAQGTLYVLVAAYN